MSTILVVEDAAVIREPLQAALRGAGYEVRGTADGQEAKDIILQSPPDLVLLDINLPGIDGLTLLKLIRTNDRTQQLPVIMLTAVAEKERVVSALKLGISAYLLKSRFSLHEMLEQVAKHLSSPAKAEPPQREATPSTTAPQRDVPTTSPKPADTSNTSQNATTAAAAATESGGSVAAQELVAPVLQPGDDPLEVLKSLKPIVPRSEIAERLEQCSELKGLSPAVSQVLRLTGSDRCSIEQVAKAISQDHAIALKVLKLANSAVYTRGEPVDSVQLAVSRIGLGQIRQTVLNLAVIDQFDAQASSKHINFGQFWEHAIAVGIIAAELAHALDQDVDSAFTMGLLHDVGRMFLADQFGEMYDYVLETANALQLPAEHVEARLLLYNHADVMDRILHSWKFPKQLINPIVFHHLSAGNMRRSAPRQLMEVAMLGLANRLAHAMMLGSSGNEVVYATNEICDMIKLDPEVIRNIHAKARDETDKVKFALLATSSTANWPQLRSVHRESIGQPFNPLFISSSPACDSYRIFCDELRDETAAGSEPNIGVIHLTNARERVELTAAYRAAEERESTAPLPLLVLSPAGKLMPEASLTAGRVVEALATPMTIDRFVQAVMRCLQSPLQAAA